MNVKIVHIAIDEKSGKSAIFAQNDQVPNMFFCFENIQPKSGSFVADMSVITNDEHLSQDEIAKAEALMDDTFIKAMQELAQGGE